MREHSYLDEGGEFIVPVPELRVINKAFASMTGLLAALVVFGASGFIGRNLIDTFAGRLDMLVGVTGEARERSRVHACPTRFRAWGPALFPPIPSS